MSNEKKIIYFYGGPGAGKSTCAALMFSTLKSYHKRAELITEYVKDWVWEGRAILPGDQMYICTKQSRRERICFDKLQYIVSDSPVYLSQFYEERHDPHLPVSRFIIRKHVDIAHKNGFSFDHIMLKRSKPYDPVGRYQDFEEAVAIDGEIEEMLDKEGLPFARLDASQDSVVQFAKDRYLPQEKA